MSLFLAADLDHVLDHTGGVWPALQGAHIFLSGGTGFIGSWLLESFVWAQRRYALDASITVLTRSPEAFRRKAAHLAEHPAIRLVTGDIRSFDFPCGSFTHIIHGATDVSDAPRGERPLLMLDTVIEGTRRTLDFAVSSGCRRFLLLSSGAVYGPQPSGSLRLREDYRGGPDPARPGSVYAEGKRTAELLCSIYAMHHGLECPIARGFAFFGPYLPLDQHLAIGNFILDCLGGRPVTVRGDGSPYRSYLYAADLAIWLWTILVHGESCRPYNVGSERAVSLRRLAGMVAESLGSPFPVQVTGHRRPGVTPERYVPDASRARQELGLAEWIPLEEGIRRTAAANHPLLQGEAA